MAKSEAQKMADKHTALFGKIYHWVDIEGKMHLHPGLIKDCDRGCGNADR